MSSLSEIEKLIQQMEKQQHDYENKKPGASAVSDLLESLRAGIAQLEGIAWEQEFPDWTAGNDASQGTDWQAGVEWEQPVDNPAFRDALVNTLADKLDVKIETGSEAASSNTISDTSAPVTAPVAASSSSLSWSSSNWSWSDPATSWSDPATWSKAKWRHEKRKADEQWFGMVRGVNYASGATWSQRKKQRSRANRLKWRYEALSAFLATCYMIPKTSVCHAVTHRGAPQDIPML